MANSYRVLQGVTSIATNTMAPVSRQRAQVECSRDLELMVAWSVNVLTA